MQRHKPSRVSPHNVTISKKVIACPNPNYQNQESRLNQSKLSSWSPDVPVSILSGNKLNSTEWQCKQSPITSKHYSDRNQQEVNKRAKNKIRENFGDFHVLIRLIFYLRKWPKCFLIHTQLLLRCPSEKSCILVPRRVQARTWGEHLNHIFFDKVYNTLTSIPISSHV